MLEKGIKCSKLTVKDTKSTSNYIIIVSSFLIWTYLHFDPVFLIFKFPLCTLVFIWWNYLCYVHLILIKHLAEFLIFLRLYCMLITFRSVDSRILLLQFKYDPSNGRNLISRLKNMYWKRSFYLWKVTQIVCCDDPSIDLNPNDDIIAIHDRWYLHEIQTSTEALRLCNFFHLQSLIYAKKNRHTYCWNWLPRYTTHAKVIVSCAKCWH